MKLKGRVWRFGEAIDTDELFAGRYIMGGDETDKARYQKFIQESGLSDVNGRENVPPGFLENVKPGDVIVGGSDFGIGSSRQQAAETLKYKGITAVVADSIHRIFFRNFWNLGCAAIELPGVSGEFKTGDEIEIDLEKSRVRNLTTGKELTFELKVPDWFLEMVEAGGLISYHKQKRS